MMAKTGRIRKSAFISDALKELIDAYQGIRDYPIRVMNFLDIVDRERSKQEYNIIRSMNPDKMPLWMVAGRMIYLNRLTFNGLYRRNKSGGFNASWSKYASAEKVLYDENVIFADHMILNGQSIPGHDSYTVWLEHGNFSEIVKKNVSDILNSEENRNSEQFVYLDPPYWGKFDSYTAAGFKWSDHKRVLELCKWLDNYDINWMLSNSNHSDIFKLYEGYTIRELNVNHMINTDTDNRTGKTEILITNY